MGYIPKIGETYYYIISSDNGFHTEYRTRDRYDKFYETVTSFKTFEQANENVRYMENKMQCLNK